MTTQVTIVVGGHQVILTQQLRGSGESTSELLSVHGQQHDLWVSSDVILTISESADLATSPVSGIKPEGSIRDIPAAELDALTQKS